MLARFGRRICFVILGMLFLTGSQCSPSSTPSSTVGPSSSSHPAPSATSNPPTQGDVARLWTTTPSCNGGNAVTANPTSSEQTTAASLATLIHTWRTSNGYAVLGNTPSQGAVTVAFFHAEEMTADNYVGLVAVTDGDSHATSCMHRYESNHGWRGYRDWPEQQCAKCNDCDFHARNEPVSSLDPNRVEYCSYVSSRCRLSKWILVHSDLLTDHRSFCAAGLVRASYCAKPLTGLGSPCQPRPTIYDNPSAALMRRMSSCSMAGSRPR